MKILSTQELNELSLADIKMQFAKLTQLYSRRLAAREKEDKELSEAVYGKRMTAGQMSKFYLSETNKLYEIEKSKYIQAYQNLVYDMGGAEGGTQKGMNTSIKNAFTVFSPETGEAEIERALKQKAKEERQKIKEIMKAWREDLKEAREVKREGKIDYAQDIYGLMEQVEELSDYAIDLYELSMEVHECEDTAAAIRKLRKKVRKYWGDSENFEMYNAQKNYNKAVTESGKNYKKARESIKNGTATVASIQEAYLQSIQKL